MNATKQALDLAPIMSERVIEEADIARYAAAIDDRNPVYRDVAPPSFAVVPIIQSVVAARRRISHEPGLHAQHLLRQFAPIRPGMKVSTRAAITSITPTRAGLLITVGTRSSNAGEPLNAQEFGVLVPSDRRAISHGSTTMGLRRRASWLASRSKMPSG